MAQESHAHWHDGEDEELEHYLQLSKNVDQAELRLLALAPRGWLIVALIGLAPAFAHDANSPEQLAIAIGGILIASRAFKRAANSLWQLEDAAISWKQVAPLFHAAARPEPVGIPLLRSAREPKTDGFNLVEAQDLTFRYQDRGEPVLRKCSFSIRSQDRILLEGHSGDGKSTLASLLIGGTSSAGWSRLANAGDRWLAAARGLCSAVPREPRPDRDFRLQLAHGSRLAADPKRYG
jgi:ATP-binding cassette subfamily B protein